jgi:PRTRC genetic system protein B
MMGLEMPRVSPIKSINIYEIEDRENYGHRSHYCMTIHPFRKNGNNHVIGEGRIAQMKDIEKLIDIYKPSEELELLPENILIKTAQLTMWTVKGEVRDMLFKSEKITVPYPDLIFAFAKNKLFIFAYKAKKNERPTLETQLYNAPLMNIYSDGGLCFGDTVPPAVATNSNLKEYESALFDTRYSHINHDYTFNMKRDERTSTEECMKQWKALSKHKKFPVRLLRSNHKTLSGFIRMVQHD